MAQKGCQDLAGQPYCPPPRVQDHAHVKEYAELYQPSREVPQGFWAETARELEGFQPWSPVLDDWGRPFCTWFVDGPTTDYPGLPGGPADRPGDPDGVRPQLLVPRPDEPFDRRPGVPDANRHDPTGLRLLGSVGEPINPEAWKGYRLGSAAVESAPVSHPAVSEAAAIGLSHDLKGRAIPTCVILRKGFIGCDRLVETLKDHPGHELGPIAEPESIGFVAGLPKTRSGKIMCRLLCTRALGQPGSAGGHRRPRLYRPPRTPSSRPTRAKASTARSRCSAEWAADSCTRMRALPRGTTGYAKPIT